MQTAKKIDSASRNAEVMAMIPGAEEGVAVVLLGIDRLEGAQRTAQALECTLNFLSNTVIVMAHE